MRWTKGLRKIRFRKKREMPGGLWLRCPRCENLQYRRAVEEQARVCPECAHHFEISARERIALLADDGSFEETCAEILPTDPLGFVAKKAYADRLRAAQKKTGLTEACIVGDARIGGHRVVLGVTDSRFLRGSMNSVVGEKITRAIEQARAERVPFVFVSGSGGGARMDEGVLSLMQMAKTSAALARFDEGGGFFISVLTNPTMGGALASFAALGDVLVAEPEAMLGFAGPSVIQETIKTDLPEGFQTSEFLLDHGLLDMVVPRGELKEMIARLLAYAAEAGGGGAAVESAAVEITASESAAPESAASESAASESTGSESGAGAGDGSAAGPGARGQEAEERDA